MTNEQIAELLALAEKATPRPWFQWMYGEDDNVGIANNYAPVERVEDIAKLEEQNRYNDAAYIVAACNLAPELANEVLRLGEEIAKEKNNYAWMKAAYDVYELRIDELKQEDVLNRDLIERITKMLDQAKEENDALRAELAAMRERERWIPVGERLPDIPDNLRFRKSVITRDDDGYMTVASYRLFDNKWYCDYSDTVLYHVTHWHELPQPPEEGGNA